MTSPLITAAREAERAAHEAAAAATKHREQVEKEVGRVTVQWKRKRYRLSLDGKSVETSDDNNEVWGYMVGADYLAALASLLPRKPVTITKDMEARALAAYVGAERDTIVVAMGDMRAALEAVASDLSAPVAVDAPTLGEPEGYTIGVAGTKPISCQRYTLDEARHLAGLWSSSGLSQYLVYALHPVVPDETEGAANG